MIGPLINTLLLYVKKKLRLIIESRKWFTLEQYILYAENWCGVEN